MDLPTDTHPRYLTEQGLGSSLPMAARDPAAWCPEKDASVSAQSLPSLLGKERSPGACGDLIDSPARLRCSEKPLLSLAAPVTPFVPGFQSRVSSQGDGHPPAPAWTCPLWSSPGCQGRGTVRLVALAARPTLLPVQTQHWAGGVRSWGNGPLPLLNSSLFPALFLGCLYKKRYI